MRRLKEAQTHDFRGGRVTEELRRRLLRMAEPGSEAEAIRGGRHGEALTRAKQRLERLLVQEQEVALRNWRERVRTVSGACKWLRQEEAPSQAIQLGDGQVVTHPAQAVETLRDHWAGIFGRRVKVTGKGLGSLSNPPPPPSLNSGRSLRSSFGRPSGPWPTQLGVWTALRPDS